MLTTYNSAYIFDTRFEPESIALCKFKLPGTKYNIKLNVTACVYYKKSANRTDLAISQTESVYSTKTDTIYEIKLNVPNFPVDRVTRSYIIMAIDNNASDHNRIDIEDAVVTIIRRSEQLEQSEQSRQKKEQDNIIDNSLLSNVLQTQIGVEKQKSKDQILSNKIIFVSTWNINCGIAYYTRDLIDDLRKLDNGKYKDMFDVNPISHSNISNISNISSNNGILEKNITGKITHIQHESGVMPKPPSIEGKVVMTWHTIPYNISHNLKIFEDKLDIVGHIIPCEDALEYMRTSKDVHVIGLGSKLIADNVNISQEDARKLLRLENIDKHIGFVFGFQSASKNYDRLIKASKETDIHLIINGTIHESGYQSPMLDLSKLDNNINVTITNRYMSDSDVDLYALASDLLLFDYLPQNHYSASSAMHRTVGAGRPVICNRINHFSDIKEVDNRDMLSENNSSMLSENNSMLSENNRSGDCLKFDTLEELEDKIKYALDNREEFGKKSLDYARRTSREKMAMRHIELYKKYADI